MRISALRWQHYLVVLPNQTLRIVQFFKLTTDVHPTCQNKQPRILIVLVTEKKNYSLSLSIFSVILRRIRIGKIKVCPFSLSLSGCVCVDLKLGCYMIVNFCIFWYSNVYTKLVNFLMDLILIFMGSMNLGKYRLQWLLMNVMKFSASKFKVVLRFVKYCISELSGFGIYLGLEFFVCL